jgi:hypothetical protein
MSTERIPTSDKELWQKLATGPVASAPPTDLDFAAWLEGRLTEREAARIEAAVVADPELRRAALELAEVLGKPLPEAPARLEVRARALVGFSVEKRFAEAIVAPAPAKTRTSLFDWLFAWDRSFAVQRVVTLTAAVVLAVSGFMMGGGLSETLAAERYVTKWQTTDPYSSNELTDFLGSDL